MTNIEKFEAMLKGMYGEDYEDSIETFIENLGKDGDYMEVDELFIRWAEVLIQAEDMRERGLV